MASEKSGNNATAAPQELHLCQNSMDHPDEAGKKHILEPSKSPVSDGVNSCDVKAPDTGGGENAAASSDMEVDSSSESGGPENNQKSESSPKKNEELVEFKMVFNKQKYDVCFPIDETIASLKKHIETLTKVPPSMQKVMFKGLCKDEKTLRESGFSKGVKVMVVGSTLNDILAVNTPSEEEIKEEEASTSQKEPLCRQKMHKKIIDKGVPEDAQPGIKNVKDSLPPYPISGMLNKSGGKVRLTFKLELDQVWIGTKERTDKIPMNSIKNIVSETIEGHEEYHIMGIQLGTTEASRYWLYWVPAQYVDAIKDAILGKWQYF